MSIRLESREVDGSKDRFASRHICIVIVTHVKESKLIEVEVVYG